MSRAVRLAVLALAVGAAGCGEKPAGVPVGQADDGAALPRPDGWRSDALDTLYADTLAIADSLRADSLAAADTVAAARAPDAADAWTAVQEAVRTRRRADWMALADDAPGAALAWEVLAEGPFRDGLLALGARDLRRDGDARVARVVVGYSADGRVVPQDEADLDRTLTLRLDVVDGAYRVVAIEAP